MSVDSAAVRAAVEIQTWFEAIFEGLTDFSSTIGPAIVAARGRRKRFVDADLKPVKALAVKFLAANPVVEGAGMLVAPGGIHENRGTIDWWRHDDEGTDSKVLFNLTPESGSSYDFQSLPWFNAVAETGRPAIAGPYVDYGGMDQYIITLMVPLDLGPDVLGMVGCDIEVADLEKTMVPLLRRIPGDAALLSNEDRVILGNSGRFLVGNRVRQTPQNGGIIDVAVHDLGLRLVFAEHAEDL